MQEIACESRRNGGRAQAVIEQCVGAPRSHSAEIAVKQWF